MAGTYTHLLYHCIWSTKERFPFITPDVQEAVWGTLNSVAEKHGMTVVKAGGMADHAHTLLEIPKTMSVSEAMKRLKGGSSSFINDAKLLSVIGRFSWQDGYGAFTVSRSKQESVLRYILNQQEHHRRQTFKQEFRSFLDRHEEEYDERYLWG